jgi:uncharacterized lipoprotein YddW (UPF0748 family)
VANWFNHQGEAAGEPAIVASDRGVFVGHTLRGADPAAKRMLVSALLGHLDPSLWPKMVGHGLEQFGKLGPYPDREAAVREIAKQGEENPLAMAALREAQRGYHGAVQAFRERRFPEAMSSLVQSQSNLLRAHCGVQVPKAGEHRAWWCHSAFGVTGISWDEAIQRLADNGFNAILPNMLWGGVAFYDSRVLPVSPEVKEKGDQIAQCVAACRKYGVQCHVWKVNWNMGYAASAEFVERMTNEHRTQVSYDGKPEPRWLCPSHPANQKLEVDSMVEVATKYDVDGIHFDYIRYPGSDNCFCSGCRERFETACGVKPTHWPADPRNDAAIRQKWLDFRRDNITKVVAAVHESVKRQKPSVKISAAVFRNWPVDRDGVGQDWKLWCDRGYLDFVCPMDYITNNRQFEAVIGQQLQWAGKVPCYPGIGLSTWPGELDVVNLIEQIHTTRRMGTGGFTVFNYAVGESREIVPLCGQGITRRR